MRLEQLYYIVEIADTGSFTASSERLFVSQPSISQSVNALEKELDVTIFKRSRSGAIPTEAGKLIIEHARAILNEINEIKSLSVQNDAELKGFLNVAAVPSMCYQILPCSIARFKAKYPNVHVRIWEGGSERIMSALEKGDVDFGLVKKPEDAYLRENKLSFKPCIFSRLYALVSQDSPLAGRKSITYQELLDWQLVLYTSEYAIHHTIVSELEKYGTPNILATVRNPQTIKRFVLQTNSVGFGPSISWDNDDDVHSGRIVPLLVEDSAPSQFGILYRKNSGPSVAGQKLMKEVQDYTERLTLNEGPEAGRSMK
ncbi:MAG: LysR family transcriptional regulator [Clostridia bacterium]|nr:LysR family transcriptional regulator [Clostridia bacterium]